MNIVQINLQRHLGGGEVYAAFLCRAFEQLGVTTRLFVHPLARFWRKLTLPPSTQLTPARGGGEIVRALDTDVEPTRWLLGHGPLPPEVLAARTGRLLTTAIAHMPVQDQTPAGYPGHDRVFAVSQWVLDGIRSAGLPCWDTPIYCVADLTRQTQSNGVVRTSRYAWDHRKVRDRLLGLLEPLVEPMRAHPRYVRRDGLTLGLVSRITPIKQFPLLFGLLVPVLLCNPRVNLEIFGSGGYASVRDLRGVLAPLRGRVRWWGHQDDVRAAYGGIDYLLAGLPEKEAFGLNLVEAQTTGTPVLATAAPPFTESVIDGRTGFLFCDPRQDGAEDFARVLSDIQSLDRRPDPRAEREHLARFSFPAFVERLRPIVAWAASETSRTIDAPRRPLGSNAA